MAVEFFLCDTNHYHLAHARQNDLKMGMGSESKFNVLIWSVVFTVQTTRIFKRWCWIQLQLNEEARYKLSLGSRFKRLALCFWQVKSSVKSTLLLATQFYNMPQKTTANHNTGSCCLHDGIACTQPYNGAPHVRGTDFHCWQRYKIVMQCFRVVYPEISHLSQMLARGVPLLILKDKMVIKKFK